jgi:uncharacterized membrane protein YsdA (DUF1294 family)/cold shock CspA family protein
MMEQGVVVRFDTDKGFGFIRSRKTGNQDVFVHASSIIGTRDLRAGQRVQFSFENGPKGPRATRVEPGRKGLTPATAAGVALALVLIAGTTGLVIYEKLPLLPAWLVMISIATFFVYGFDKYRAQNQKRRVPEMVLLGLALFGGTVGAMAGMSTFRHKTKKLSFLVPFVAIVVAQVGFLGWWLSRK